MKYTVQGEWFPEVLSAMPGRNRWGKSGETPLDTEMRLFCACTRWAFKRLLEGGRRKKLKSEAHHLFVLNSRWADDAIHKAQWIISSQRGLVKKEIAETEIKLGRARRKLRFAERDLERAESEGNKVKAEKLRHAVRSRWLRVESLQAKLNEYRSHDESGTIPKVIFGGRTLWRRVCKGHASREKWLAVRKNRLYARGDRTKQGNLNLRVGFKSGGFTLSAAISHLVAGGKRAPRIGGQLWLPEKHRRKVLELLASSKPYTVEVIKGQDGRYRVYITFEVARSPLALAQGFIGVDTNPGGVSLANVDLAGMPEPWPEGFAIPYPEALHKFPGEFRVSVQPNGFLSIAVPELAYSCGSRRAYLAGVLAKVVVDLALYLKKQLAVEALSFGKDRLGTAQGFNRMASNFPYAQMVGAVLRRAAKAGVGAVTVWPAYTSTIGLWKYAEQFGVSVHQAAALVIARRAAGMGERITEELKAKIRTIREKQARKGETLPGEGKGMTRRAKRFWVRLDEKLLLHNGLDRWRQQGFHSVWRDLKSLALR